MLFLSFLGNITANVMLHEVANFVTVYFPLKIKIIAKEKCEFYTNFTIVLNNSYRQA
jgi:hypothetical protein